MSDLSPVESEPRSRRKSRCFFWWECISRVDRSVLLLVAVFVGIATFATRAFGESSVLLVVAAVPDQDPAPFELRLRSELAAEGLEVVTASGRAHQDLLDLEGLARRTGALAALSVFVDVQDVQGRLWVSDPNANVDLVRTLRVMRTEGDAVSLFALRAVEALRGARLELEQQRRRLTESGSSPGSTPGAAGSSSSTLGDARPPAEQRPASTSAPVPPKTNKNPPNAKAGNQRPGPKPGSPISKSPPLANKRWLILGSGIIGYELNGLKTILGPGLEARLRLWPRLSLGVALDGPLLATINTAVGTVKVNQELLELQGRVMAVESKLARLDVLGGVGASRFAVSAVNLPTSYRGFSEHSIGWTLGAGLGILFKLSSSWAVGCDLQWLRRFPAPVIIANGRRLTGKTDSLLLGKLGIGVMF